MNYPAIIAGKASMEDTEYFLETVNRVKQTRSETGEKLRELGFTFPDSQTNFIFAKPPEPFEAKDVFERLKEAGIYVRHFNKPRIKDYLRISIGTDDEMMMLINTLKGILKRK